MEQSQRARKKNKRTGKGTENRLQRLYETLLPENLGKHCREWPAGKTESEMKLLIQENGKLQDLIVYTDGSVTKDQSGWGFTVKQGATTIHEVSASYTVSTSGLTDGDGSNHPCPPFDCKRWQSDHTCQYPDRLLQKVKNVMDSPD